MDESESKKRQNKNVVRHVDEGWSQRWAEERLRVEVVMGMRGLADEVAEEASRV